MRRLVHSSFWLAAALTGALALASPAAQAWPERPLRIVVGYSPGGIADAGARIVAEQLQKRYGQAVTVENRAGASGRVATTTVVRAEPDGHTLLLLVGGDAVVAASDPKLPYNLVRDLQFIGTLSVYPFLLVASPASRAASLRALIEVARKEPGTLRYATTGRGSTQHLVGELLAAQESLSLVDVPYKGTSASMTDLLTARVDFSVAALSSVRGEIQTGRLRALAVTSRERMASLPEVPAVAELVPGYDVVTWMGLAAPARTPAAVIDQLNSDLAEVMAQPAVRERFAAMGADPRAGTPQEMRELVSRDVTRWRQLIQSRRIALSP